MLICRYPMAASKLPLYWPAHDALGWLAVNHARAIDNSGSR